MKKSAIYIVSIMFFLSIILVSGCLEKKKEISSDIVVTPIATTENVVTPVATEESRILYYGYVMLLPKVLPSEVKTKYDYDYVVRVTIENNGPDVLAFDIARSYFELGGLTLAYERNASREGRDKWKIAPYENLRLDFSTRGGTDKLHNISRQTGEKRIKFYVGVINDGKLIDRPYMAEIPELEKLSESGINALTDNQLIFSPVTLTHKK